VNCRSSSGSQRALSLSNWLIGTRRYQLARRAAAEQMMHVCTVSQRHSCAGEIAHAKRRSTDSGWCRTAHGVAAVQREQNGLLKWNADGRLGRKRFNLGNEQAGSVRCRWVAMPKAVTPVPNNKAPTPPITAEMAGDTQAHRRDLGHGGKNGEDQK
jgi:hypothetical protein